MFLTAIKCKQKQNAAICHQRIILLVFEHVPSSIYKRPIRIRIWHDGLVVTVTSQQEVLDLISGSGRGLPVQSLHVLFVNVWTLLRYSGFLPLQHALGWLVSIDVKLSHRYRVPQSAVGWRKTCPETRWRSAEGPRVRIYWELCFVLFLAQTVPTF